MNVPEVVTPTRNPVAVWGTLGLAVGFLLQRLIPDLLPQELQVIQDLVVQLGPPLIAILYARLQVTPTKDPRTEDGQPAMIVPKGTFPTRD